jgi:hypothetical protein
MKAALTEWQVRSQGALGEAVEWLRAKLEARRGSRPVVGRPPLHAQTALGRLTTKFGLTPFESNLLLLAVGVELDSELGRLVAELQGGRQARPTLSLALSFLDEPHFSALAPGGVLRRGRLLRPPEGAGLVDVPLVAEEAVLHYLVGSTAPDDRLAPFFTPLSPPGPLPAGQDEAAAALLEVWRQRGEDGRRRKAHLAAADPATARWIAAAACGALEFTAFVLDVSTLPAERARAADLLELWERDAVLNDLALVVDFTENVGPERPSLASWLLDRLNGLVAVVGPRPPDSQASAVVQVTVPEPGPTQQADLWREALGPLGPSLNGQLGRVVEQFRLPPRSVREIAAELRLGRTSESDDVGGRVWQACRRKARGGLDGLAQRLEPRAGWDDLVLPEAQAELLRSIALQARHRFQVYEEWGFRARSTRGFGVSALFWGPSGTGKTLAAEVLAADLDLDLYRIDLSAAVSKYIGETEKNLRRIFDAAEASGAILLFDEADSLFGKRSEVKDSHDRYANLEISYLLQRMEAYRGLAILTTNLKGSLDRAFLRRLRFVIQFPFPSAVERERIWRRAFPAQTPLEEIDHAKLARLAVTGGNIANIALDAAFRAAHEGTPVTMGQLLSSARAECAKIEKPLSENEIRGWV